MWIDQPKSGFCPRLAVRDKRGPRGTYSIALPLDAVHLRETRVQVELFGWQISLQPTI